MTKFTWIKEEVPSNLIVKQVYGIVFSNDKRIILQVEDNKYNLTGGKPLTNETYEKTLKREYIEELNIEVDNLYYLGYLLVEENIKPYAQVRMIGKIKNIYKNFPKDRFWKSTFKKNIIVFISLKDAYDLLTKDIINKEKDLYLPKNRWILHSLYVSEASKRIAFLLGLNDNKATILGLLHDIGRRINHNTHEIDGYKFLNNLGFYSEAKVCITHSFLDNDINLTLKDINKKTYNFINFFLQNNKVTIYDNIIQLCDLFCLETGFTTIEKRLLDIFKHIDIDSNDNYEKYFEKIIELKEKIENMMQCSLYDLFPEIKKEDLINKQNDYNELINLFNSKKLKNNML